MVDIESEATATWKGDAETGSGELFANSGKFGGVYYSFPSRFRDADGSNPEEFIGAAQAACYNMVIAEELSTRGHPPDSIKTDARVRLHGEGGEYRITKIHLQTRAVIPGIDEETFQQIAEVARDRCPIYHLIRPGLQQVTIDVRLI